jgi:hypothetical protein
MNRSVAIGLGAALVGAIGTILLDRFTHGVTHTVLTILMIVPLITALLVLHHMAENIWREIEQPGGGSRKT